MNKTLLTAALVLTTAASSVAIAGELKTYEQKLGYALGMDMAKGLQEKGLKIDPNALLQGFKDQMAGNPLKLSQTELDQLAHETQQRVLAYQQKQRQQQAEANKKKEAEFFAQNAKAPGVKTLPEGIQYQVLKSGNGPHPKADDTVVVHYTGMHLDGKVFDSSIERGKPIRIKLDQVIKGWQIVLPKMKVGDQWKVWIPAELAYGERGAGGVIGPNEPLVFEIELLNIEPKEDKSKQSQSAK